MRVSSIAAATASALVMLAGSGAHASDNQLNSLGANCRSYRVLLSFALGESLLRGVDYPVLP
jgi:hypothetical protein